MHAILYVCLRRTQARTSLQARKMVCEYLSQEGFDLDRRFGGHCDYFSVGGRWSGILELLRLKHEHPKTFAKFWKKFQTSNGDKGGQLFKKFFPDVRGPLPINRHNVGTYGRPDDAQIMDVALFQQLKKGFSEDVTYADEISRPNVIFTDDPDDDFEWPKNGEEAKHFWVVVIDYHF